MTLARVSNGMFPRMPSFFDRFFDNDFWGENLSDFAEHNSTLPAVNIKESDNEYQIEVAAPGMKKKDFEVGYYNGQLVISSESKIENEEKSKGQVTRREFHYASFKRSFNVPEGSVDSDKISATYTDGILHVVLPKRDEVKPKPTRHIAIS